MSALTDVGFAKTEDPGLRLIKPHAEDFLMSLNQHGADGFSAH